jgi:hypothetical protein
VDQHFPCCKPEKKKNAKQTRTQSKVLVNGAEKASIFHGIRQEIYIE